MSTRHSALDAAAADTRVQLFIDGEWTDGTGGESRGRSTTLPPARVLGTVPHAGAADLDRALAAASRALQEWRAGPSTSAARSCTGPRR